MSVPRITAFALTCLVSASLTAGTALAKEFRVDDDGMQCKKADFTTISAAVSAAAANPGKDQIRVCSGLYKEQVTIAGSAQDGLKLFADKNTKLTVDTAADPSREAIIKFPATVLPTNPRALVLVSGAHDVEVSGFRITGPYVYPACAPALDRT